MSHDIQDVPEASRFEIRIDDDLAGWVDYREHDGEYALPHTRVLPQFGGRGVGSALVVGSLRAIGERGGRVLPYCPFVPKVMRDHPELIDLVPADRRAEFGL